MRMTKLATVAVMTALAGFVFAADASAQTPINWGDNATSFRGQNGNRLTFFCPGGGSANTVWGTDIYTDDSSICTAAVHAGAMGWGGGVVTIQILPGMQSYGGSNRNGVSTQNYPAWTGSYSFVGGGAQPAAGDWSRNAQAFIGQAGPINMSCPPNGTPGSVWGTDYYTTDSSVCTAALHAGVIDRGRGGNVTFYMSGGLSAYPGSSRNGVTTSSWGSYTSTFAFTPNAPVSGRGISWSTDGASVVSTGQSAIVLCPAGGSPGSVWGTDFYSSDSSICTAAVHAGAIGWGGGAVQITGVPGQGGYAASSRNGVTTSSWGSYHSSFVVTRAR